MLCSKGYPENYKKNVQINGLDNLILKKNQYIFHAGTKLVSNNILAHGGRVLNFVSLANDFKNSRNDIIKLINQLNWENGFYRKDIGHRVID